MTEQTNIPPSQPDIDPVDVSGDTDTVSESSPSSVDDLSLAEVISAFFRNPRATVSAVSEALHAEDDDDVCDEERSQWLASLQAEDDPEKAKTGDIRARIVWFITRPLTWYAIAFFIILQGNIILAGGSDDLARRSEDVQLAQGTPYILLGVFLWICTEIYAHWEPLRVWWKRLINRTGKCKSNDETASDESPAIVDAYTPLSSWSWEVPLSRYITASVALLLSVITWFGTSNNSFNTPIFYIWLLSIALWTYSFTPKTFDIFDWLSRLIDRMRGIRLRDYVPIIVVLALIMGMAFHFRFHRLAEHPREMTDDHVEKILDAGLVRDGARAIFFANNGGREPAQMYFIALASYLPGLGINHDTIKWVSSVESLLTIPALFWMGYALLEGESTRRRLLVGLLCAAFAAASYWHVAITRQGLRIPLTALVVSLHLIYLLRGIRFNKRKDFIIAGLILGFGLYTYQAVRMLPVVVLLSVLTAIVFIAKSWRDRFIYVVNLTVLVAVSFVIFLPMFHYSLQDPDSFWKRTSGRLLGDDTITETLADGTIIERDVTLQERFEAFQSNLPTIANNIRNVLLMFNWEGDVATISGVSTKPAMDTVSATLLIVGLVTWLSFSIQRRETAYFLVPIIAFTLLLPSALSIAFPGENPSHTRTSGALPLIYLMTAFPLALVVERLLDASNKRAGQLIAGALCVTLVGSSFQANTHLYFDVYPETYEASFDPYSDAGDYLYGYILRGGTYGNAFLVGYEHWWSHRAVGLEGGLEQRWENGIYPYTAGQYNPDLIVTAVHDALAMEGIFQFQADSDLLFFYSPNDTDTSDALTLLFPAGREIERQTYKPNETFMVYEVPALGTDGLQIWLAEYPRP